MDCAGHDADNNINKTETMGFFIIRLFTCQKSNYNAPVCSELSVEIIEDLQNMQILTGLKKG
jgi:hypothetical protein